MDAECSVLECELVEAEPLPTAISFIQPNGDLVPVELVKEQIERLTDPTDLNDLARSAAAAKMACDQTDERYQYFGELAVWLEMRLGTVLLAMPKHNGARGAGKKVESHDVTPLSDIGICKMRSARSQKLASAPEAVAEYVAECKANGKDITKAGARTAAKKQIRSESLAKQDSKRLPVGFVVTAKQDVIKCDSLITDPPYGITSEPWEPADLEAFTREWLVRWRDCGAAWFVSFFSQRDVWSMRKWMDDELVDYEFHHLAIWHYGNGMGHKPGQVLKESWEPIFIYKHRSTAVVPVEWDWNKIKNIDCIVEGAPRNNFEGAAEQRHPCQKPVRVMQLLTTAFCTDGGLVADPFCGSGTTGIAARLSGRNFHGIELDAEYRKLARQRIKLFGEDK